MFWNSFATIAFFSLIVSDVSYQEPETLYQTNYIEVFGSLKQPSKKGDWEVDNGPTVFVCQGTPINKSRLSQAMRFWNNLGYELNGPIMNSNLPACRGEQEFSWGNIIVTLRGQNFPEDKLAVTRTFRKIEDDTIVGAVIEIQHNAATKERAIEHEIGHAFGWQHFNRKYHMMNSIHQFGGWDTYGLRRTRR